MSEKLFDRDQMAQLYANEHLKTDPGIAAVHYLPTAADNREIRFVEINTFIAERTLDSLEPIDFGVDMGTDNAHKLFVLDVTPDQWKRLQTGDLKLPEGWTLKDSVEFQK